METMKIILMMAITMALSITLTMKTIGNEEQNPPNNPTNSTISFTKDQDEGPPLPSKRLSRFLAEDKNPRAADHCRKNVKMCEATKGKGWTCCNNKCMDLYNDKNNCGGCKRKCKYTEECCKGKCVDVAYDKRHCGQCNHRCVVGEFCVYGLCEYA